MRQSHRVRVAGLPVWLDLVRLLGPGGFHVQACGDGTLQAEASLERAAAADLEARLRGVGLGGRALVIEVTPPLHGSDVRAARAREARRYRARGSGFCRRGTRIDAEGRRSLTPESIALDLATRAAVERVVDAGCGAGGNAIAFARAGAHVVAIDIDRSRLELARHNAGVYGVQDRIEFVHGDAVVFATSFAADLLFVDPPWGARYDKRRVTLAELPLLEGLLGQRALFARFWAKVPPSFDVSALPGARVQAAFGRGEGDAHRVKFLLLEL